MVEVSIHIKPVDASGNTVWPDPEHVLDNTKLIDYDNQDELIWWGRSGWCYGNVNAGDPTQDPDTGEMTIPFNVWADFDADIDGTPKNIGAKVKVDSGDWTYCASSASTWHSKVQLNAVQAPERITDVIILDGQDTQPPAGYTKEPHDLNSGTGGDHLYFAYRKDSRYDPLTSFWVIALKHDQNPHPPAGYNWCNPRTDLNKGAGGDWIYAAQTTDPSQGQPVDQLQVEVTGNAHANPPAGWNYYNQDLNAGARGKYIFLEWHNQPYDSNTAAETGPVRSRHAAGPAAS